VPNIYCLLITIPYFFFKPSQRLKVLYKYAKWGVFTVNTTNYMESHAVINQGEILKGMQLQNGGI